MLRRDFFRAIAAVACAPIAAVAALKPRRPTPFTRIFVSTPHGPCPEKWKNYTATYTNVNREELIEKLKKAVKTHKFSRPKSLMFFFRDNPVPLRTTLND